MYASFLNHQIFSEKFSKKFIRYEIRVEKVSRKGAKARCAYCVVKVAKRTKALIIKYMKPATDNTLGGL